MPSIGTSRCESCGSEAAYDDDLVNVQRVYLVTKTETTVGAQQVRVLDDIERWCFVCRSMYPHAAIDAE